MAIELGGKRLNAIRYVSRVDNAIDRDNSDREAYEEDPIKNADKLVFLEDKEPTYFVLNFEVNAREASQIKDSQAKGLDEDKQVTMTMGKWSLTVCKIVLKGIVNPQGVKGIPFKKDGRGYASDATLDQLSKFGIVDEIWQLYLNLTKEDIEEAEEIPN